MKFFGAGCEACGRFVARADDLVAFRRQFGKVEPIELGGEQPWSGVRVICLTCLDALGRFARAASGDGEDV